MDGDDLDAREADVRAYAAREHLPLTEASVADALDDIQREREKRGAGRHDGTWTTS